jgi:hypothetical protein
MPAPNTQRSKPRRAVTKALRFVASIVGVAGVAVGATFWLASPDQARRSHASVAVARVREAPASGPTSPATGVPTSAIPLFSEDWFDDSGYDYARTFARLVTDTSSLAEIRSANEARYSRGLAEVDRQLGQFNRRTAAGRERATYYTVLKGLLHMAVGEFAEADRRFAEAQVIDPAIPRELRLNIEALRGMAALRRGETENCIACCNGASCIFPLAPEAVHTNRAGSSEAVRRFTTYLEGRPEDLGLLPFRRP